MKQLINLFPKNKDTSKGLLIAKKYEIIVWGDDRTGLSHVIQRRDKLFIDGKGSISGIDMAKKIPEIITNGDFSLDENTGRIRIHYDGYLVSVKLKFDNKKVTWLVTSMEVFK